MSSEVLAHIDGGAPLSGYPGEFAGRARAADDEAADLGRKRVGGIDLALEAELASSTRRRQPPSGTAAHRRFDEVARELSDLLDLVTFFTAGEKETRAWPLRRGATALDAAESIHSDIAAASSAVR